MRVLIINTNESSGGAAKAANRLYKGLRNSGIDAFMLVQKKESDDKYVVGARNNFFYKLINYSRSKLDKLPKLLYKHRKKVPWNVNWLPNPLLFYYIKKINPDIINLHWVNNGFISIKQIGKLKKMNIPIVWTLHDMWPFTGGCHYTGGCEKYKKHCGACFQLESSVEKDLSYKIFEKKGDFFGIDVICLNRWMKKCVEESSLFSNSRIEIIPNGFDLNIFKPRNKKLGREKFNLPLDKKIILFGAVSVNDKRKGFFYLEEVLKKINNQDYAVAIFGKSDKKINLEVDTYYLGNIKNEEEISLLYSSADVFVCPSLEDNLPNTLIESISSGTPAVAFEIGGIPDIIDHKKNGYLAKPFDVDDLKRGIEWCIEDKERNCQLGKNAREKAESKFSTKIQIKNYIENFKKQIDYFNL
jgi:glycosyltransferase involved in cell wall biosynthesis